MSSQSHSNHIYSTSHQRLTDGEPNFPPSAQEQCLVIIRHLQSLKYEDTPDYDLIDSAYRLSVGEVITHPHQTCPRHPVKPLHVLQLTGCDNYTPYANTHIHILINAQIRAFIMAINSITFSTPSHIIPPFNQSINQ